MKKIYLLLIALIPVISFAQITNGSFEADPYDDGWVAGNGAIFEENTVTDYIHSGSKSLKFTSATATSVLKMSSAYTPGTGNYIATLWVKGSAGSKVKLQNIVNNGSNNYMNFIYTITESETWEKVEAAFAIDAETTTYKFQVQGTTVDAVYYFDDIEIISVTESSILNGNFESGITSYWYPLETKNDAIAVATDENTDVNGGSNALKIDVSAVAISPSIGDVQIKNSGLIPLNGSAKVVSFFAKADALNSDETAKLMIAQAYMSEIGKSLSAGVYSGSMNLTSEYRQYKYAFDYIYDGSNPASYVTNTIRCGEVTGSYYIDDITIEEYPGAPTITSSPILDGTTGTEYSYAPISSNVNIGNWSLTKPESGAEWLTIDRYTGEISGTPVASGSFDVTITLNDGINIAEQSFTITIGISTDISDKQLKTVQLYPNPVSTMLYINADFSPEKVEIYNLAGSKIYEDYNVSNGVDVSSLSNGVYIISVINNGNSTKLKFYKK